MPLVPQRPVHPAASPAEAMAGGYFAQVRFLLERAGPAGGGADGRDPVSGRTPLMLCALVRDPGWAVSLARLLLEKGARVGLKDSRGGGLNALHYACAHGRDRLSELYLQAIDYRVNDTDGYGNTPMHYAVRSGRAGIVEELLAVLGRFQLPASLPNREGVTPLMLAYMGRRLDIAGRLLDAGADADAVDAFGKATAAYQGEAVERLRAEADAAEAKAAGRKLRFDDIDGWRRYQTRLRSAPAGGRGLAGASSSAAAAARTFKEAQRELRRARMYQPDEADLISAASPLDRRNDPAAVFRTTPAEFFGPASRQRQQQQRQHLLSVSGVGIASRQRSSSARPRARSAAPPPRRGGDSDSGGDDSDRSCDSREMKLLTTVGCNNNGDATMSGLFRNYEYHCSSLYRPPPRAADPALYVQDFSSRYLTPPQADAEGAGGDAASSPSGRRRKDAAGRKGKRVSALATAAMAMEVARKKAGGGAGGGGGGGRVSRAAFGRDE